ncbi:2-polyprenyl-6-methoxyphenol hydroxylase-like FAD-dependent oxidoreductase [Pseudonocardia endophytica]|uniref:2-polyprenyl-6-methoxyphenol hydroxylase-like FAD-dependent oxidoreductase n=1 Tax=Pseudonocardia endophytica TaxID=401976 RepID=A0A4R1HRT6_PSEEN|nr:2-polyprenyl-6-methoxyphenol hydroxylase-like FAD-dependent oxidoreductase [Pseudonocardia endophytica]
MVVGGSVAGLLSAGTLLRRGWGVTVRERTTGALQERGAGVILPVGVHEQLVDGGFVGPDTGAVPITRREWFTTGPDPAGRVCYAHPLFGMTNNWGVLWRSLTARLPALDHRRGSPVSRVVPGDPPLVESDDGTDRPDLVVGADGYRSAVRTSLAPCDTPSYAGYVLWRGTYDAALAPSAAVDLLERGVLASPVHPGGHAVVYLVPGHDPGTLRMNWAMYGRLPSEVALDDPDAVPFGALDETFGTELERVLDHVPPLWAEVMRIAPPDGRLVQPIYDHTPSTYAGPGVVLAGDAAAVARPHTGSGVAKAAEDAFTLGTVLDSCDDLAAALTAYDAARRTAGASTVDAGRRLGRGMVEELPDWTSDSVEPWAAAIRDSGPRNYMFDDRERPA